MKKCYRNRGAVSVFLTLILLPTIVFGGLVTDAVRIYHSEGLVSEAGELAMNAGLSYYNMELKDDYGLFVMEKNPEEMKSDLAGYFADSLRAFGTDGSEDVSSMLDLRSKNFEAFGVEGSEIYQTEAEKQQILEYMKYRAPVCLGEELFEKLTQIKESKKQTDAVYAQVDYADAMDDLQDCCEKALKELDHYIGIAESGSPITVTGINNAIQAAEAALSEAAECYFLIYVIDQYGTMGSAGGAGDVFSAMSDFNTQAEILSAVTKDTAKDNAIVASGMQCLKDWQSVNLLGGPPSLADLEDDGQKAVRNAYVSNQPVIGNYRAKLKERAEFYVSEAHSVLSSWYTGVIQAQNYAKKAQEKLNKLKEKLSDAREKHETWEGKVNALSTGEMKESMQKSLSNDSYSKLLDGAKVDQLYQKLETNIQNLGKMKTSLEAMKICGVTIVSSSAGNVAAHMDQSVKQLSFYPNSEANVKSEITDKAKGFMASQFVKETVLDCELFSIKNDEIYKELKKICEEKEETEKSKEDKKKTDQLMDQSKMEDEDATVKNDGTLKENTDWTNLPSDALGKQEADLSDDYEMSGGGTSRSKRKKAMSNAKDTLSSTSDLLSSVSKILETGIEKIYIMEYGMQMFSYYTVDKDNNGKKITGPIHSISDDDLTDNKMYKSEVEYMLWGQKDTKANIQNTRLLLYGIRALFNFIYAFSDSVVSSTALTMATAMSCGVAFLVPVFEVVIKVAVACAETYYDVKELMEGKPVALIKKAASAQILLPSFVKRTTAPGGVSSGVTMNYREYLTVFLLIHTFGSGEEKTLARIADCIQLNTKQDIVKNGYTMLSVKADVDSRTTFMSKAAKLPDGGSGAAVNDWYTITYQSVLGY